MTKRARDPSPNPRKVSKSSGASDEAVDSTKKRGRDAADTTSSKKPTKSPKVPSPAKPENESVTEQRKKAQEWAAAALPPAKVLPSGKKTSGSPKEEYKTQWSKAKTDGKTSTGKKPPTKKDSATAVPRTSSGSTPVIKNAPKKPKANINSTAVVARNTRSYGDIIRLIVSVHVVFMCMYLFRLMRPKNYVFPFPMEALLAVLCIGIMHALPLKK